MKNTKLIFLAFIFLTLNNCKTEGDQFNLTKRYRDTNDYANVIRTLKYDYQSDEKLPTFGDPKTRVIVEKLTDQQNYNIVLDDNELGLKYKNEIAETFFNRWKDMNSIYRATDRKDNYLYEREMIEVFQFGLALQLKYFKLGNDQMLANSDDPNSDGVKFYINSNINSLINNFILYLDEIKNENAFSIEGKKLYAKGINKYFTQLIEQNPEAKYNDLEKKIDLLLKKSESQNIKSALNKLDRLIDSKKQNE